MTDNEIISIDEAIRHCYATYLERDDLCRECREEHKQLAKWLEELKECRETIKRQKAEIEELRKGFTADADYFASEYDKNIKAEAIKEFAERLKERADSGFWQEHSYVDVDDIDNLVKEMTEEK